MNAKRNTPLEIANQERRCGYWLKAAWPTERQSMTNVVGMEGAVIAR